MQFSPKKLLPSLASKVYNEDNRRELIRLAKDYDVANNLVSEDNTSKEWVDRRERRYSVLINYFKSLWIKQLINRNLK